MDQRQREKETRRAEVQNVGPQELLILFRHKGINLLNRPFVTETILDEEFAHLKQPQSGG